MIHDVQNLGNFPEEIVRLSKEFKELTEKEAKKEFDFSRKDHEDLGDLVSESVYFHVPDRPEYSYGITIQVRPNLLNPKEKIYSSVKYPDACSQTFRRIDVKKL